MTSQNAESIDPASLTRTPCDERELRNAFGRFATGVCVVTTLGTTSQPVGLTVNSFSALSLSPALVLWCLADSSKSRADFEESNSFAINVLSVEQQEVSSVFATSQIDKFSDIPWSSGYDNAPLLAESLACFECRKAATYYEGDHLIFVGAVERFSYDHGEPLIFSAGKYNSLAAPLT